MFILKKKSKGKFLLFSKYDGTFQNVKRLNDEAFTNNRVVGSSAVFHNVIRQKREQQVIEPLPTFKKLFRSCPAPNE